LKETSAFGPCLPSGDNGRIQSIARRRVQTKRPTKMVNLIVTVKTESMGTAVRSTPLTG
jgi:hypothetical protein